VLEELFMTFLPCRIIPAAALLQVSTSNDINFSMHPNIPFSFVSLSIAEPAACYGRQTMAGNKIQFNFSFQRDLVMPCHIPPLKKAEKQGEMLLPIFSPIPSLKCRI